MEESKSGTVRAVDRALDILLCFTDTTDLGLTEIAEKTGLHKSTVFRLLASLEAKGFVTRDSSTEKYKLGFRIWELSVNLSQGDDPATILLPEMERLRDILGETISLYIRDGSERIRIQAVQSKHSIRRVAPIGARLPLYVGASSKVLIAFADMNTQENMINDWKEFIDISAYKDQMAGIRKVGYATSVEEREPGVAAVSAPVFNRSHQLVAALSVSGPLNRLTLENMKDHAGLIIESANRMGNMLR
ncbi:IclR family transcriptional regulator [Chengkuizengella axinellae]|uniref:IclR family transcriptional regulator n=1 Tax=Chengkuizengella axinellae TaxID=3064388 RepID=A0ABT9J070_9BACL|nr:IclR family transcriptional regulator [Chengkuizengella sp. 2205SS18-9]MDP5275011.1 IclR family transcriptional regulator [Chengkuizengella sp. 2205SS18-9]